MNSNRDIDRIFELQNNHCETLRNTTASARIQKLKTLQKNLLSSRSNLEQALYEDLKKPWHEAGLSEIYPVISEIKHACKNLEQWMRPADADNPLVFLRAKAQVRYEPKGVVLILSPWNYPFQLALCPVVSAVAAGNCVIVKPSELSPGTSRFIKQLLEQTFEEKEVAVFEGDQTIATDLLAKPFHHIFFTGSTTVGKIVMQAAAKHLASVTLELGGKSPVIIDENYDLDDAARKIAWGKVLNTGQSCVAPDYVLVPEKLEKKFIELATKHFQRFYDDPETSKDYGKIISAKHWNRLKRLLDNAIERGGRLEYGGKMDESKLFLSPTIVSNLSTDSEILQEEIFGPLLAVVPYKNLEQALDVVRSKARPLSLYIFSSRENFVNHVLDQTHSGGVCVNDVAVHFGNVELPFGGINQSGIGNSHGFYGFKTFSHERAVLHQPKRGAMTFFYPPYTEKMKKLIQWTIKYF